ncbi:hypothetical protein ACE6H2_020533 [Prunus campanulata]
MANDKATSEAHCKLKGKKLGVPPRKKAQGNNSNSIVTTEQGQGSEPKHQSPTDHPLFGLRRYVHKNHNASNPVLHVKVTDHLSYKVDIGRGTTMTPKDFSAITGLLVCGKPLKYDMEAHKKPKEVVKLFGTPIASLINTKTKYRDIVEKYKGWKPQTAVQKDQLTRVFILALIGSTLCDDKSDSVYLYYMPSLAKVNEIKDYNWGGAGLSCLYLSMDAISRRIVSSSGGYWRAWKVNNFMLTN